MPSLPLLCPALRNNFNMPRLALETGELLAEANFRAMNVAVMFVTQRLIWMARSSVSSAESQVCWRIGGSRNLEALTLKDKHTKIQVKVMLEMNVKKNRTVGGQWKTCDICQT